MGGGEEMSEKKKNKNKSIFLFKVESLAHDKKIKKTSKLQVLLRTFMN